MLTMMFRHLMTTTVSNGNCAVCRQSRALTGSPLRGSFWRVACTAPPRHAKRMANGKGMADMTRKCACVVVAIALLEASSAGSALAQQACVDWQGHPLTDSQGNSLGSWSWPSTPACTFAVPYPNTTRQVSAADGTELQTALNNAMGGDEIRLTASTDYYPPAGQSSFILPVRATADGNHWIVIRSASSAFGPSGSFPPNTRVDASPGTQAQMPRLRNTPNSAPSAAVITTAYGAHHFRLVGLDLGPDATNQQVTAMVSLGDGSETSSSQFPTDIVIDRCYIHGADTGNYRHGVTMNGVREAVIESYVTKFNDTGSQSSGVGGWNGPGPFKIVNNFIDALGENIIFGGSIPTIAGLLPSDIEVRRNFVTKTAAPGTTNGCNLFELKYAQRVLVEGNIFEKNWTSCQDGTAVLLKSVAQSGGNCNWCVTQNVTFRDNIVRHAGACFNIAAVTEGNALPLNHVRIENVVCDDISGGAPWTGSGKLMIVQDGMGQYPSDVQVVHLTGLTQTGNIIAVVTTDSAPNFVWTYNLTERQCYGINQGGDEGSRNFTTSGYPFYGSSTYGMSTIVNTSSQCSGGTVTDAYLLSIYNTTQTPTSVASNWTSVQIDTTSSVGVLGTTTPTYRLASSSPYYRTGSQAPGDGKDMGADIDAMFAAFNGPGGSAGNIVIYASDIPAGAVHGMWSSTNDPTSPNGVKLVTPDNGWDTLGAPIAAPADYVDVTFNANAGVPYTLWLRIQALNNSKWNDSVWVQFSDAIATGSSVYPLNSTSGLLVNLATDSTASSNQAWGWVNGAYWFTQPATVTFATSGTHTMRIQVREDGIQFDQIVLSPTTYFNPSASCPNTCAAAPGPVSNDQTIVPKS
jgi:hypothetical protein